MEHTTAITTTASCRRIGNCHVKNSYIFRYGEPWQLPACVGRCGVALKLRARIFAPTFDKTLFFSWLAKMTVENLCKTAQISNRNTPIATRKWLLMTISKQIATRNEPFSRKPLHCISGKKRYSDFLTSFYNDGKKEEKPCLMGLKC